MADTILENNAKKSAIAHARELINKFKKWLEDATNPKKNPSTVVTEGRTLLAHFKKHLQGEAIDTQLLSREDADSYQGLVEWAESQINTIEKRNKKEGTTTLNLAQAVLAKGMIDLAENSIAKREKQLP